MENLQKYIDLDLSKSLAVPQPVDMFEMAPYS